jgi:hypothetical protein
MPVCCRVSVLGLRRHPDDLKINALPSRTVDAFDHLFNYATQELLITVLGCVQVADALLPFKKAFA